MSLFNKIPLGPGGNSLESDVPPAHQPLAERMRPRTFDEFVDEVRARRILTDDERRTLR